ncbi:MAG: hypothetical protein H7A05_10290 [Pseudomonadales bacterium]|nr:hypothetical protein [Pseudomonadales bacterium]MCP5345001.1 hypothetical protein [Pseudomonadales bacterium]
MEQKLPWPYKEGYNYDAEHIRIEVYRLLNQFLAQEKTQKLMEENGLFHNAIDQVGQYFDVETQRILISAATISRVIDDNEEQQFRLSNFNTACGVLIENTEESQEIELTLREACNKIMHASAYRYDIDEEHGFITPTIYLYGSYKKKQWKATIDIVKFASEYLNNIV